MVAIALVATVPALLALIYIGSSTVFEDVVSLSTSGLYASYLIPCSLLLWWRTTGQILPHHFAEFEDDENIESQIHGSGRRDQQPHANERRNNEVDDVLVQLTLVWGPWHIPGIFVTLNNIYAVSYTLFVLFWSFWPPELTVSPGNMNYSVLMTGVAIIFSVVYYFIWVKKQYLGPLIEREVRNCVQEETIPLS